MTPDQRKQLIKAIAITAELCNGTRFSDAAVSVMLKELEDYPYESVLKALRRCYREVKGKLALVDIFERMAVSGADSKVLKMCPVYEPEPPALPPSPEDLEERQKHIDRFKRTVKGILDRCE
jgi:hypothetical protein